MVDDIDKVMDKVSELTGKVTQQPRQVAIKINAILLEEFGGESPKVRMKLLHTFERIKTEIKGDASFKAVMTHLLRVM